MVTSYKGLISHARRITPNISAREGSRGALCVVPDLPVMCSLSGRDIPSNWARSGGHFHSVRRGRRLRRSPVEFLDKWQLHGRRPPPWSRRTMARFVERVGDEQLAEVPAGRDFMPGYMSARVAVQQQYRWP